MNNTLETVTKASGRANNLDFLRVAAALLVLFSHSWAIAYGQEGWDQDEPLNSLSHGHLSLGGIAVVFFFIISGYLVAASYERSPGPVSFLSKRAVRIFPGLAVLAFLSAFVIGPLVTHLPIAAYFSAPETYFYAIKNLTMLQYTDALPGVFEGNPHPGAVNGSLWTLRFEVLCYLGLAGLGICGALKRLPATLIFLGIGALNVVTHVLSSAHLLNMSTGIGFIADRFLGLSVYFLAGTLAYLWRERLPMTPKLAVAALILQCLSIAFGVFPLIFAPVSAYVIFWLAFGPWLKLHKFGEYGDFSYGIYIYGWPVQQVVYLFLGSSATWWSIFLGSLLPVVGLAALSWHLVEKRFLRRSPKPQIQANPG